MIIMKIMIVAMIMVISTMWYIYISSVITNANTSTVWYIRCMCFNIVIYSMMSIIWI
jgi:hypothetical protein